MRAAARRVVEQAIRRTKIDSIGSCLVVRACACACVCARAQCCEPVPVNIAALNSEGRRCCLARRSFSRGVGNLEVASD